MTNHSKQLISTDTMLLEKNMKGTNKLHNRNSTKYLLNKFLTKM